MSKFNPGNCPGDYVCLLSTEGVTFPRLFCPAQSEELKHGELYLIRAYDDLTHLKISQERFYSSPAWREGPRQAIIDKISVSVKTVMVLSDSAIDSLRVCLAK